MLHTLESENNPMFETTVTEVNHVENSIGLVVNLKDEYAIQSQVVKA